MNAREATKRYRQHGQSRPLELCCDTFWRALQSGTDGEGYGSLISVWTDEFRFNSSVSDTAVVCPWCGKPWPKLPAAPDSRSGAA